MKLGDRDTDFTRRLSYSEKLLPRVNSKLAQYRQAGTSRPQDKTYLPALKQNTGRQFVTEVMASQAIHAYQVLDSLYYTIIDNICCLTGSRRLSSIQHVMLQLSEDGVLQINIHERSHNCQRNAIQEGENSTNRWKYCSYSYSNDLLMSFQIKVAWRFPCTDHGPHSEFLLFKDALILL